MSVETESCEQVCQTYCPDLLPPCLACFGPHLCRSYACYKCASDAVVFAVFTGLVAMVGCIITTAVVLLWLNIVLIKYIGITNIMAILAVLAAEALLLIICGRIIFCIVGLYTEGRQGVVEP